jgi:hypothetical protein
MLEFVQQNWVLLVIGCLVFMTLFFMTVAAAALFVARLSGQSLLGPILAPMLRALSVKGAADDEDIEDAARMQPHRHLDVTQVKAETAEKLDFDEAVEKYREQQAHLPSEQGGSFTTPEVQAAVPADLPATPIAPPPADLQPAAPNELPVTPIAAPLPELPPSEPPATTLGTGGGGEAAPEQGFTPLPRPEILPGQRLDAGAPPSTMNEGQNNQAV